MAPWSDWFQDVASVIPMMTDEPTLYLYVEELSHAGNHLQIRSW